MSSNTGYLWVRTRDKSNPFRMWHTHPYDPQQAPRIRQESLCGTLTQEEDPEVLGNSPDTGKVCEECIGWRKTLRIPNTSLYRPTSEPRSSAEAYAQMYRMNGIKSLDGLFDDPEHRKAAEAILSVYMGMSEEEARAFAQACDLASARALTGGMDRFRIGQLMKDLKDLRWAVWRAEKELNGTKVR